MTTIRRALVLLAALIAVPAARTDVALSVRPLDLTRPPSTEELVAAGQLGGPLHPMRDSADTARERRIRLDFGRAIQAWNDHDYPRGVKLFRRHIATFPDSPWVAEAELHLGCDAQYQGRYHEARSIYRGLIERYKSSAHPGGRMMAHKARLRLGGLEVLQYDFAAANEQFRILKAESPDWRHRTYASHWIQRLSLYRSNEAALLTCGTQALAHVLEAQGRGVPAHALRQEIPGATEGQSVDDLLRLAGRHGQTVQARRLAVADLARVPLPAIVHLEGSPSGKSGHYWVVEETQGESLRLFDPQSGRRFEQTAAEFAREWGGYALVLSDRPDLPGVPMDAREESGTRGGCCGAPMLESGLGDPGTGDDDCGAPVWSVNMVNMNFYVSDTPLWFTPPYGPPVRIRLSYNSQSAIAYHEPFGAKWQFNYATYLVIDTGGTVTVFMPDGRRDAYTPNGQGGFNPPYMVHDELVAVGPERYELRLLDGTVYVYSMPRPAGGVPVTQLFLEAIRDTRGLSLSFSYDPGGRLVSIADALGRLTMLTYDGGNRVSQIADPFGRTAQFEYDGDGNLARITDMGGHSSSIAYDADRYLTSVDGARGHWQFRTEPADGVPMWSDAYPPPGEPMWANYRITVTNPLGNPYEYYYYGGCEIGFGCGGYSWYVSPRDYLPWRTTEINHLASRTPKTRYVPWVTAGGVGVIRQILTPEGRATFLGYDLDGNLTSVSDPSGHTTYYVHGNRGQVLSSTDPNGAVTTYAYAPNGVDVTAITDGLGTTSITYNSAREVTSITDRLSHTTTFAYGALGQLTSVTDPVGVTTNFTYGGGALPEQGSRGGDVLFRRTHDAAGRIVTQTTATGMTVSVDRDPLGRIERITFPDGLFRQFEYEGCCLAAPIARTERSGLVTRFVHDALFRPVELRYPDGAVARLYYDKNGNITRAVDRKGNATRYEYDLDDLLTRRTFSDGTSEYYGRDAEGLIHRVTNGRGQVDLYSYDFAHHLAGIDYGDATPSVTYAYDLYGRLVSREDGIGTTHYTHDAESRLAEIDGPWDNDTVRIAYDAAGHRTRVAVDGGAPTDYAYDVHGRARTVTQAARSFTYTFTGASSLTGSLTGPGGVRTTFQYDSLERLTEAVSRKSDLSLIARYAYAYDADGRRTAIDIADTLQASSPAAELSLSEFNGLDQLLSSTAPSRSYMYDADGNQTVGYAPAGETAALAYDSRNRLASFEYASAGPVRRTEYLYDGEGWLARVVERDNGVVTRDRRFVRLGGLALQERNGTNTAVAELTWGREHGGGIGGLLSRTGGGQDLSYLYDGRGNVVAIVDGAGAIAAAYRYDPFGRTRAEAGPLADEARFATKAYDARTGLAYFGFRQYSPATGRWITRDPAGERDGLHPYAFVRNDPVNRFDRWGLDGSAPGEDEPLRPGARVGPVAQPSGEIVSGGIDDDGNQWTRVCDGGVCETYICDPTGTEWFGTLAMDYGCSPGPCTPKQRVNLTEEMTPPKVTLGQPNVGICLDADCTIRLFL